MSRALLGLLLILSTAAAFYVPGVAPTDFEKEQQIEVKAVKMTSAHTQVTKPPS
jgi:transmembrane 9 superfamily protein 2/4